MKLYIPIGISGSGKTTTINKIDAVVVSPDLIRIELYKEPTQEHNGYVFYVAHSRVDKLLGEGRDVVFDATNIALSSVRVLCDIAKKHKAEVEGIILNVPLDIAKDRVKKRAENGGINVPESIIENQYKVFQENLGLIKKELEG